MRLRYSRRLTCAEELVQRRCDRRLAFNEIDENISIEVDLDQHALLPVPFLTLVPKVFVDFFLGPKGRSSRGEYLVDGHHMLWTIFIFRLDRHRNVQRGAKPIS